MTCIGRLGSVFVGGTQLLRVRRKDVASGMIKHAVSGSIRASRRGLDGDAQAAREVGDDDRAASAYSAEHYDYWCQLLERDYLQPGMFGENFSVHGLLEDEVRIGDIWRIGTALLQITQPRIPCSKLDARVGTPIASHFLESCKTGYLFRVIRDGELASDSDIELIESSCHAPTVAEFTRLTCVEYWNSAELRRLLAAPELSQSWLEKIHERIERAESHPLWTGLRRMRVCERTRDDQQLTLTIECARSTALPPLSTVQQLIIALRSHPLERRLRVAVAAQQGNVPECYQLQLVLDEENPAHAQLEQLQRGDVLSAAAPWTAP